MKEKPSDIPVHVALAMTLVYGPNPSLESYIRCRGTGLGTLWYVQDNPRRGEEMLRAYELVSQAMDIARENGWDWEDVCALARETLNLSAEWRTVSDQRYIDCERESRRRAEEKYSAECARAARRDKTSSILN